MIPEIHLLTARPKMEIIRILHSRHTPDEIASELGMTRQAVDKNIKDLVRYGIVTRTWKTGSRRPRVEFSLSEMGMEFYSNLEKLIQSYRREGNTIAIQILRDLDLALIKREISPERYMETKEEIKRQYGWFLESS
jgi:predicted transcriptional regulator